MTRRRWAALLALAAVLWLGQHLLFFGGLAYPVRHQAPGPCRLLAGVPGPEDFALDRERGVLYISSHDRRQPRTPGAIFALDVNQPLSGLAARRLPGDYPQGFYPHGLSLYVTPAGERRLYVITHPGLARARSALDFGTEHRIDIFAATEQGLRYRGAIRSTALQNPNDLYVRAEDDIYVTRDHGATTPGGKFLEDFLPLSRASVLHFDGRELREAATGITYANGITGSGGRLYVAACLGRAVLEYAIDLPGQLRLLRTLPLGAAPDNLELDSRGALWTGAHRSPLRFLGHAHSAARPAPSQAVRLSLADGQAQVVYADPGGEISGSSVAVRTGRLLLIGAVFDRHMLACEVPDQM
jgi:arylesterase/paraoxonase